jgi:hypothetical protein
VVKPFVSFPTSVRNLSVVEKALSSEVIRHYQGLIFLRALSPFGTRPPVLSASYSRTATRLNRFSDLGSDFGFGTFLLFLLYLELGFWSLDFL